MEQRNLKTTEELSGGDGDEDKLGGDVNVENGCFFKIASVPVNQAEVLGDDNNKVTIVMAPGVVGCNLGHRIECALYILVVGHGIQPQMQPGG